MTTRYIIEAIGIVFLVLGVVRALQVGVRHPQARTWLLVGAIFSAVSGYLFYLDSAP